MEIRKARLEEYCLVKQFLNDYWKPNHSLVKSKMLIDFQHKQSDGYNYYIAIEGSVIWGILGFITTSLYDRDLCHENDVYGAIWKVRDDCPYKGIGIELMDTLLQNEGTGSFAAIGISSIAKMIYRLYGMKVGKLSQYYIVNNSINKLNIGQNLLSSNDISQKTDSWSIKRIIYLEDTINLSSPYKPTKTIRYLINRYQNHPIYRYLFYGIYNHDDLKAIWVGRRIVVEGQSVFRIVDMFGDIQSLPNLYSCIQDILMEESFEYMDVLNYGIEESVFRKIGFALHDDKSTTEILPIYFEPFLKQNIEIDLAIKANYANYVAFKGDSDQDRPNIL